MICVVEQPTDVIALEKTGVYKGSYHCLGGKIAPLDNIGPDDLRIESLLERIQDSTYTELILGVGSDVEGEATANYLADLVVGKGIQINITRLAQVFQQAEGLKTLTNLRYIGLWTAEESYKKLKFAKRKQIDRLFQIYVV